MDGTPTLFDTDFGKAFAGFSSFDTDKWLASQRKTFEALTRANQRAAEGMQAVARRQVEIAREVIDEASAVLRDIAQPVAPGERIAKSADLFKQNFEQGFARVREINLMLAKATTDAFDIVAKRVTESFDEIRDAAKKPAVPKKRAAE